MTQGITIIKGVEPKRPTAIELAHVCYKKWKGMASFQDDLTHYLLHGIVISQPNCFVMVKVIDLAEEGEECKPAWFVRIAVGDLRELIALTPGFLPAICFCRRGDGRLRVFPLARFIKAINKGAKLWAVHHLSRSAT
jgi:hypothetical protein